MGDSAFPGKIYWIIIMGGSAFPGKIYRDNNYDWFCITVIIIITIYFSG
jgi:hypothetical protein